MIYNLPLHQEEIATKSTAHVITMTGSKPLQHYALFIGNDSFYTHFVAATPASTISVNTTDLARQTLKMYLQQQVKPSYIVCNFSGNIQALEPLINFLQRNTKLRHVPLFIYKDEISITEREAIRKLGRIDDILTSATSTEAFQQKLSFAIRMHEHAVEAAAVRSSPLARVDRKMLAALVNRFLKRTFDIACAGTLLLLVSPLLLIIAILIKLESKGPVFYIAHRAGNNYKLFKFYKFRTMKVDADKQVAQMQHLNGYGAASGNGPMFFKLANDPRITRLGGFLRNTSLDELPQLLNVILGDMSLVGNRPLPLYEAASLTTDQYAGRFLAPAGITGLWQIKKRGTSSMSADERIGLDIDYATKHSFLYDMWIIANTPSALIQKENV